MTRKQKMYWRNPKTVENYRTWVAGLILLAVFTAATIVLLAEKDPVNDYGVPAQGNWDRSYNLQPASDIQVVQPQ